MATERDRRVLPFFILTWVWSWAFYVPIVPYFRAHGMAHAAWWAYLALLAGAYGPSLMALALTARTGGRPAVRELLRGFLAWKGRSGRLLTSLLLPSFLSLGALALYASIGGGSAHLDGSRAALIPLAIFAAVPFGPLAEEVGWRGFAQPRLLERWSPLATGAILGTAWTAWHIPLFFAPAGTSISGEPVTIAAVAFYLALLVGMSILIVHLSLWTGATLLTGFLVHLGLNAEIYRLVLWMPDGGPGAVERWALVPIWGLVAVLTLKQRQ